MSPTLQQLDRLDRSSPDFHDQLRDVLYGEEYQRCASNLQGDDLVWLVDYLDKVRRHIARLHSHLSQLRLSMTSILPVPLSGNVYANSEAYAAPGERSQHHTHFRPTSSTWIPTHSPQEAMATCTRGLSMAPGFVSNEFVFTLAMVQKRLQRRVIDIVALPVHHR